MPFERSSFGVPLIGLAGCVAAYGGVRFGRPEYVDFMNMTVPLLMGVMLLYAAYRNVLRNHLLVWSPLPYFFGSCALYFGLGPTMYLLGSGDLIWRVNQSYAISPEELIRTNMLNALCISIVLGTWYAALQVFSSVWKVIPDRLIDPRTAMVQLKLGAIISLSIGLPIRYLFILPAQLHLTDTTVHGLANQLGNLTQLSIVQLCILAFRCGGIWRLMFYGVALAQLVTSALTFAKIEVLTTLIMLTLGYYAVYPRPRTLIVGFSAILAAYLLLVPLVQYGRAHTDEFTGGATMLNRFEIVKRYADEGPDDEGQRVQGWWERLSYAKYQAFAMAEYDASRPGETVELALYVPIPRAIWPDKPRITVGRDFHYLLTGFRHSQSAPGIFAEAYWNGGWLLVIIVCTYVGVVFACFTIYSLRRMALQQFFFLPVVFFGIQTGFRPDGWFASAYVGDVLNAILIHWVLVVALSIIPTRRLFSPRLA
jgi:hypothetical protein